MFRRRAAALIFAVGIAGAPLAAAAGPYGDDLARCLVRSTSPEDQTTLIQWMFAISSLNPAVKRLTSVTDAQRSDLNRQVAGRALFSSPAMAAGPKELAKFFDSEKIKKTLGQEVR